ncbi:MAG: linked oxidase-like protein [Conexibacter sp.]|nr:linked oxidase-like protein [Conexibacter sp.]
MSRVAAQQLLPTSAEEAAAALHETQAVRIRGGGTKLGWGRPLETTAVELRSERLDELVAHNEGDLTAVLQAGVSLARAQEAFAAAGQMLALDPPDGGATIGGVVATGDSGPLRHRYGAPRDLVLGVQVALPDGAVARAGSKVIKNVAGYDLAKLMSGAFGTLGLLTEVTVRLHPRPLGWCTAVGRADDPHVVAQAAVQLAHRPLEAEALDLRWEGDAGAVLARFGGSSAKRRAEAARIMLRDAGLEVDCVVEDEALWATQRDDQRGSAVLRVSATQERLGPLLDVAREHGARVVARAAHGLAWLGLREEAADSLAATVAQVRAALAPSPCVLLDAPAAVRAAIDPWGPADPAQLELMRRVKSRFDPKRRCNPGLFVGGI